MARMIPAEAKPVTIPPKMSVGQCTPAEILPKPTKSAAKRKPDPQRRSQRNKVPARAKQKAVWPDGKLLETMETMGATLLKTSKGRGEL